MLILFVYCRKLPGAVYIGQHTTKEAQMMLRMSRVTSQDIILCEICQGEFQSPYLLQMHKLCHFNTGNTCYVCDKVFPSIKSLLAHIASVHRVLLPIVLQNSDDKDILHCEICMQCFSNKQSLHIHQDQHNLEEATYQCKICGLHFEDCHSYVVHLNKSDHHEMKLKIQNGFVCLDCRAVFGNRDAYAMHMMLRAQNEGCNSTEKNSQEEDKVQLEAKASNAESQEVDSQEANKLINYSPRTDPGSVFNCSECNKGFGNRDSLAMHMLLHTRKGSSADQRCNSAPLGNILQIAIPRANSNLPFSKDHLYTENVSSSQMFSHFSDGVENLRIQGSTSQDCHISEIAGLATSSSESAPITMSRRKRKISFPSNSLRGDKRVSADSDIDDTWSDYGRGLHSDSSNPPPSKALDCIQSPVQVKAEPVDYSESSTYNCTNTRMNGNPPDISSNVGSETTINLTNFHTRLKEQKKIDILNDPYLARLCAPQDSHMESTFDVLNFLQQNISHLYMCKFCKIVFVDRTLYHLHMGLHNLNNPWQCNLCGKRCEDSIAFTSHVIHYE